jgi:hypothetical protein
VTSRLYDTKLLSSAMEREDIGQKMNLQELYEKLLEITQTKIAVSEGFTNYLEAKGTAYHEAGYDAFVTGSCFQMLSKLNGATNVFEEFQNKIRIGSSKLFMVDFGSAESDVIIADVNLVFYHSE